MLKDVIMNWPPWMSQQLVQKSSLSDAAFRHNSGGTMLARTGNQGSWVGCRAVMCQITLTWNEASADTMTLHICINCDLISSEVLNLTERGLLSSPVQFNSI